MGLFPLDLIHDVLKTNTGLKFKSDGSQDESPELPYIQFSEIIFDFMPPHQIVKKHIEDTPSTMKTEYTNFQEFTFLYTIVNGGREVKKSYERLRTFYNYLTTEEFKLEMDRINIGVSIASTIETIKINVQQFIERRSQFEITYFHNDTFTNQFNTFIKTAVPEKVPSPAGA